MNITQGRNDPVNVNVFSTKLSYRGGGGGVWEDVYLYVVQIARKEDNV